MCFHKFTLTSNLIANNKYILACCPGLRARNMTEPRELPLSLIWDKNRLGVRSWGGGGMPENCHWTEVGRLHIYIYIYVYIYTHTHTHTHTRIELVRIVSSQNQNKLRQTKSRRTVATSPRCFKNSSCHSRQSG